MFKDDEDVFPSSSHREYFQQADHGKKEMQERKKMKDKNKLNALQRSLLRQQVQKPDLKKKETGKQEADPSDPSAVNRDGQTDMENTQEARRIERESQPEQQQDMG